MYVLNNCSYFKWDQCFKINEIWRAFICKIKMCGSILNWGYLGLWLTVIEDRTLALELYIVCLIMQVDKVQPVVWQLCVFSALVKLCSWSAILVLWNRVNTTAPKGEQFRIRFLWTEVVPETACHHIRPASLWNRALPKRTAHSSYVQ